MPFNSSDNPNDLIEQINDLLDTITHDKKQKQNEQNGGSKKEQIGVSKKDHIISEINSLLSKLKNDDVNLSENQLIELAMKGGSRSKKNTRSKAERHSENESESTPKGRSVGRPKNKSKGKSKSKGKTKSKSKGKTKSKSKGKSKSKSKGKSKSKSKSKSKGRTQNRLQKSKSKSNKRMKRTEEHIESAASGEKKKRPMNKFMKDSLDLKKYIKTKIDEKKINNVGAMSSAAAKLLKDNDKDLEKAKKNFNAETFMDDYNAAVKKQAEKKAQKTKKDSD